MLKPITESCEQFSEYSVPPFRFRTLIPKDNIMFNKKIFTYFENPVLHIVDTETGLQNATFIKNKTAEILFYQMLGISLYWIPRDH